MRRSGRRLIRGSARGPRGSPSGVLKSGARRDTRASPCRLKPTSAACSPTRPGSGWHNTVSPGTSSAGSCELLTSSEAVAVSRSRQSLGSDSPIAAEYTRAEAPAKRALITSRARDRLPEATRHADRPAARSGAQASRRLPTSSSSRPGPLHARCHVVRPPAERLPGPGEIAGTLMQSAHGRSRVSGTPAEGLHGRSEISSRSTEPLQGPTKFSLPPAEAPQSRSKRILTLAVPPRTRPKTLPALLQPLQTRPGRSRSSAEALHRRYGPGSGLNQPRQAASRHRSRSARSLPAVSRRRQMPGATPATALFWPAGTLRGPWPGRRWPAKRRRRRRGSRGARS